MSRQSNARRRGEIMRQMGKIAGGRVNDAVKLAYLDLEPEQRKEIDGLDLTALTEFKRSASGALELKLTDRVEVLEKMLAMLDEEGNVEEFFKALGK